MPLRIEWDVLADGDFEIASVPMWTLILDYVAPKTVLQITAAVVSRISGLYCPPDGLVTLPASFRAIADYPAGALLGKISGSTAGQKEGKVFAIGASCTVTLGDADSGALFVAINADPMVVPTKPAKIKVSMKQ